MSRHERLNGPYARLETKTAADTPANSEIKALTDELMRTVTEFRTKNDESIAELRTKKIDDVVLREHVDRINAGISEVEKKLTDEILEVKRAAIFAASTSEKKDAHPAITEYRAALDPYLRGRYGSEQEPREMLAAQKKLLESKALVTNVADSAGFLVTPQMDQTVRELSNLVSPIRNIAAVQTISGGSYEVIVSTTEAASGWVGEIDTRAETTAPKIEKLEIVPGEIFAKPLASQRMLDDSFIDVEQWLAAKVSRTFAKQEGAAFVSGNGIVKPRGFLNYPTVANASYAWGSVGYIVTGTSAAFTAPAAGPPILQGADVLYDVIGALAYDYRPGANWVANRRTVSEMRKFKDLNANYIWSPMTAGQPATIAGYAITEAEDMPDIAANSFSVAFGDFRSAYQIVDRVGVRTLRDPYSSKPYIEFYTTKRVGGGVVNFEAYKLLKFGTS
jgi:HK97 family phage major capsid protein